MLKVGFARLDITPPLGTPLAGYYEKRIADNVLDPVSLNAVAISNAEDTILLITADVLAIRLSAAMEIRELICKKTGVPVEHILINALHQHTSVQIGHSRAGNDNKDLAYLDILYRRFTDVAQLAIGDMAEATYATAVEPAVKQISFVRRYFLKNGKLASNPVGVAPEDIIGPASQPDNNVRLVRFVREGKKDIALVNFCTHPDMLAGTEISADWPGFVRRFVEADHPNAHCILMNGFQGDTNQHDYMLGDAGRRVGYQYCQQWGRVIADTVNIIWDKVEKREGERLFGQNRIAFIKSSTRGEEHYAECKRLADKYRAGDYSMRATESGISLPEACRIADIPDQPVYHKLMVTVLGLGDIAFFGLGGEPFTEYIRLAAKAIPDKFLITTMNTNGAEGYFPSAEAFAQGGYEVVSSHFTPELEDKIMDAAKEMMEQL